MLDTTYWVRAERVCSVPRSVNHFFVSAAMQQNCSLSVTYVLRFAFYYNA